MSARRLPHDKDQRPIILRLPRDPAPIHVAPPGFAMVPNSVLRHPDLTNGDKVVFAALAGLCYGRATWTRATTHQVANAAGVHPDTVLRAFRRLTKFRLICRRPDLLAVGGPWITWVLAHPKADATPPKPTSGVQDSEQHRCSRGSVQGTPSVHDSEQTEPHAVHDRTPSPAKTSVQNSEQNIVYDRTPPPARCTTPPPQKIPPPPRKLQGGPLRSRERMNEKHVVDTNTRTAPDSAPDGPPYLPVGRDGYLPVGSYDDDDFSPSHAEAETPTHAAVLPDPNLVARARQAWPSEPALERRLAELVELAGDHRRAALAVEYALARRVKRLGYTFVLLRKSWRDLSLAECEALVAQARARQPTPAVAPPPAHRAIDSPAPAWDPVYAALFHRWVSARGPLRAQIQAEMTARAAELEAARAAELDPKP